MTRSTYIVILALILIGSFSVPAKAATEEELVLLFDEGHKQFFTYDLMKTALSQLNNTFDTEKTDFTIKIVINNEGFTSSNLQGADLLVVSNPGINKGSTVQSNIPDSEKDAVNTFVDNGGSVLYMGNPFTNNWTIAGHKNPMDKLIVEGLNVDLKAGELPVDNDNTTIIIDDFNNDGNESHIYFNKNDLTDPLFFNEVNNITQSKILYYGGSVAETIDLGNDITGTTNNNAYSIDKEYDPLLDEIGKAKWLSAKDFGEDAGRALLIGSTIMFSDLSYDDTSLWIEQESNLQFFENMIAWLFRITPLNVPSPVVTDSFSAFFTTNVIAAILIGFGFVAVTFGILIYRGNITVSNIFKVGSPKPKTSKKKAMEKKKAKTTKKKAKTTKKRRKRT